jgi:hypothetical protein
MTMCSTPDAPRAHLAAHRENPDVATAALAHTSLDPETAKSPPMRHVTEVGGQLFSCKWLKRGKPLGYRAFWGGRGSCKRELLLTHGVFNPAFRFGCEDIECAAPAPAWVESFLRARRLLDDDPHRRLRRFLPPVLSSGPFAGPLRATASERGNPDLLRNRR